VHDARAVVVDVSAMLALVGAVLLIFPRGAHFAGRWHIGGRPTFA
jgi:hypothetical protein